MGTKPDGQPRRARERRDECYTVVWLLSLRVPILLTAATNNRKLPEQNVPCEVKQQAVKEQ
ncbi:MAG: hypothetical protein WKF84_25980 [Pyrinomonadaceae bacterium]